MAVVINTNVASLNAQRNLNTSQLGLNRSMQRLSSGLRINSAKDDAAGLAISDRMTAQIRGLNQAARNAQDGISMAQTAEGALAETTNGLYKAECVRGPDAPAVWGDLDQLELETLSWVHWFNEHRLHSHCDDTPPAEFEAAFYAAQQTTPTGVGNQ